jgi:hypothetical protein
MEKFFEEVIKFIKEIPLLILMIFFQISFYAEKFQGHNHVSFVENIFYKIFVNTENWRLANAFFTNLFIFTFTYLILVSLNDFARNSDFNVKELIEYFDLHFKVKIIAFYSFQIKYALIVLYSISLNKGFFSSFIIGLNVINIFVLVILLGALSASIINSKLN